MPILILFDKGFANFDIVIITQSSDPKTGNRIKEKSEEESKDLRLSK